MNRLVSCAMRGVGVPLRNVSTLSKKQGTLLSNNTNRSLLAKRMESTVRPFEDKGDTVYFSVLTASSLVFALVADMVSRQDRTFRSCYEISNDDIPNYLGK